MRGADLKLWFRRQQDVFHKNQEELGVIDHQDFLPTPLRASAAAQRLGWAGNCLPQSPGLPWLSARECFVPWRREIAKRIPAQLGFRELREPPQKHFLQGALTELSGGRRVGDVPAGKMKFTL